MYSLIRNSEAFDKITIDPHLPVYCDTETCVNEGFSSGGLYGQVRLFQLYQSSWKEAILIDCFFIPLQKVLDLCKPHHLVFHNGAYDLHTINLFCKETWLPRKVDDTIYLARLRYFIFSKFSFYDCLEYTEVADEVIRSIDKKEEQKSDWKAPLSAKQKLYAACDVIYLEQLFESLKDLTDSPVYELDIRNLELAVDYTRKGIPVNQDTVKEMKKEFYSKLEVVLDSLPINPRSSIQCKEYLGKSSSAKEVLQGMVIEGSSRAKKIMDARHYYKGLEYLNRYDRPIIKGFFQPCTALSGRFSCTGGDSFDHANLQQTPRYLKHVLETDEGERFVYKDYSGLELRMAVAFTGEPVMAQMMKNGMDLHAETAKYIFNKESVTDKERDIAKAFNFMLIYGGGIKTAKQKMYLEVGITMSFAEVKSLINKWFDLYEGFKEWHDIIKDFFNIYGYVDVETALGRQARLYRLTDALNLPIQGSSVEVQKVALGMLFDKYPDADLRNTIHDSNTLISVKEDADMWGERLDECMVDAWYYVISDLADPDIPMPKGYETGKVWKF